MIVSLDWLAEYVDLPEVDALTERLLLSGLNHESTKMLFLLLFLARLMKHGEF